MPDFYDAFSGAWPARMARAAYDALRLPGDVFAGRFAVRPEEDGQWSEADEYRARIADETIRSRATDLAGLAMLGASGAPRGALGSGPVRRRKAELPMDEASRLSRADDMGFRRDMPLKAGRAPQGETVGPAALSLEGRIFTGRTHSDAMSKAERTLGMPFEAMRQGPIVDGFVTSAGRYVSRWEAEEIARRARQGEASGIFGATRGLAAENLNRVGRAGSRSGSPDSAATAAGFPGGKGVWAVPVSPGSAASSQAAPLWHRTERPGTLDAANLADWEIQATLREAFDAGHDAVMMKNYTRPGGKKPETVIVVRDQAQLRSPNAAFDPRKRDSADLLAGTLPFAVLGGWSGSRARQDE